MPVLQFFTSLQRIRVWSDEHSMKLPDPPEQTTSMRILHDVRMLSVFDMEIYSSSMSFKAIIRSSENSEKLNDPAV